MEKTINRETAFTIQITDFSDAELWELLSQLLTNKKADTCEKTFPQGRFITIETPQPEYGVEGVFWFDEKIPKELFQFTSKFNVLLSGTTGLWYKGNPVTGLNYRKWVGDEESGQWEYLLWSEMSSEGPPPPEEPKA